MPLLAFERWLCRSKLVERDLPSTSSDPFLPCKEIVDPGLVADLQRGGVNSQATARSMAMALAESSATLALKLCPSEQDSSSSVFATWSGPVVGT